MRSGSFLVTSEMGRTIPRRPYSVRYRSQGANLIYSPVATLAVRVDPDPPMSAVAVKTVKKSSTVTLSAQDTASGVASISYRVDAGRWQVYSAPFTVTGVHRLAFFAADKAGNVETAQQVTVPAQTDVTPPSVTGSTYPQRPTGPDQIRHTNH